VNSPLVVVDEHLDHFQVTEALQGWITAEQIGVELRSEKRFSDERIISLLIRLKRRTFVTIDSDFYKKRLCHRAYCLIYFHLTMEQQAQIPALLRRLFKIPGFRSVRERMGKVVHVSHEQIRYHQLGVEEEQFLAWADFPR
jgi:hypothetical protein